MIPFDYDGFVMNRSQEMPRRKR